MGSKGRQFFISTISIGSYGSNSLQPFSIPVHEKDFNAENLHEFGLQHTIIALIASTVSYLHLSILITSPFHSSLGTVQNLQIWIRLMKIIYYNIAKIQLHRLLFRSYKHIS